MTNENISTNRARVRLIFLSRHGNSVGVVLANEPSHSIVAETDDAETEHDVKEDHIKSIAGC